MMTIMAEQKKRDNGFKRHVPIIIIGFFVVISLMLNFYKINDESFWADEQNSVRIAKMDITEIVKGKDGAHPPGYHLFLHTWIYFFGASDSSTRGFSAVFATASVVAIFFLGKELFNAKTGLVASILLAISQFFVYYAQEARPYTLLVFITITSTYFLHKTIKQKSFTRDTFFYIITAIAGFYSHYFFIMVAGIQLFYLFVRLFFRKQESIFNRTVFFIRIAIPIVAAYLVWGVYKFIPRIVLGDPGRTLISWVQKPSLNSFNELFKEYSGIEFLPDSLFLLATIIILILFIMPVFSRLLGKNKFKISESWSEGYVFFSCYAPLIAAFLVSQKTPIWVSRYLIITLPFLILIIARALTNIKFEVLTIIILIILAVANLSSINKMYAQPEKEDWRSATKFLLEDYKKGDLVVYYNLPSFLVKHYSPSNFNWSLGYIPAVNSLNKEEIAKQLENQVKSKNRFFMVYTFYSTTRTAIDRADVVEDLIKEVDNEYNRVKRKTWSHILVDEYEKPIRLGNQTYQPVSVNRFSQGELKGRFGPPYQGITPLYSRGDYIRIDTHLPKGNFLLYFEVKGNDPPPAILKYQLNDLDYEIRLKNNMTTWRTIITPIKDSETLKFRLTFVNDTFIIADGKVIADNAVFARNFQLIEMPKNTFINVTTT